MTHDGGSLNAMPGEGEAGDQHARDAASAGADDETDPVASGRPDPTDGPTVRSLDTRAEYLAEVARQLWPEPARVSMCRAHRGARNRLKRPVGAMTAGGAAEAPGDLQAVSEFVVLPGLGRPRLLVPLARRPAATALRRYGKPNSLKARLATKGLSLVFRSGLGPILLRDRLQVRTPAGAPTIESYLSTALGLEVTVSLYMGSARANRKPVLQVLTARGDTIGYAKVGVNELTTTLVGVERDALEKLAQARLTTLTAPRVLHYGSWQEMAVIVLSPLPVWLRDSPLPKGRLEQAMREVAALEGVSRTALVGSYYWESLSRRLATADDTEDRAALFAALAGIGDRAAGVSLSFGACHGDWAPWNMAGTGDGLLVWDWERFATGVPLGFDALHYWLQQELQAGRTGAHAAALECAARAASLIAPLGVEAAEAELTATVYLADLATRYLVDRQEEAGAVLGHLGSWLIPALNTRIAQL